MSDKEIEQFNRGHMVEVEMDYYKGLCGEQHKVTEGCPRCDDLSKDLWNAAIDKCIEVANKYDSYGPAYEMRMLKK